MPVALAWNTASSPQRRACSDPAQAHRPRHLNVSLPDAESALFTALEHFDVQISVHCGRTALPAIALGRELDIADDELLVPGTAALLHDVGKIHIPDAIVSKPGRLDVAEWTVMRTHSASGAHIVAADGTLPLRTAIAHVIHHHHEHFDGNGYPDGLRGEHILLLSRIVFVADSYDAMTELRVYRPPHSHRQTLAVLVRERGTKHDPEVFDRVLNHDQAWFEALVKAR